MESDVCCAKNCTRKILNKKRKLCERHYKQFRAYGSILLDTRSEFNKIVDKGSYYELILTNMKMIEVGRAKIDKEDLNKVQAVGRWHLDTLGYVRNYNSKRKPTLIFMHNVIMDLDVGEVDHKKSGIKYRSDNRKKNLRKATHSQNMCNRGLAKNNTSGYKGVFKISNSNNWQALIILNKKRVYLGSFSSPELAHKAYCKAAKELHGEFSNFGVNT